MVSRMHITVILAIVQISHSVTGKKYGPYEVKGLLDQSIELYNKLDLPHSVDKAIWYFERNGTPFEVAETKKVSNNRLQLLKDGTVLRIEDLRAEDSGIYFVGIARPNTTMIYVFFNLAVYDPVPTPDIRTEWQNVTGGSCNMSLHCSVPTNTSGLSYTWKYRHRDTEYKLYNNTGNIIQPSLRPESWDMEFLCIVHNPADQKNVSVRVHEICIPPGLIYGPYEVVGLLNQSIKFGPYEVVGLLNQSIKFGPYEVVGLLNQSIKLCKTLDPVDDVVWFIEINEKPYKVPEFKNDLKIQGGESNNHLKPRKNGTMLCIEDLRAEDTGSYFALITCPDIEMHYVYVNLTVYEPVPAPAIRIEGKTVTSDWCNMSLHCSVPTNTSVLSYTWKYRHRETEYQPYNNTGSIIQMSLQPESWNMEFLCIVHNPADQKNDSVRVHEICTPPDEKLKRLYLLFLLVLIVPIVWALSKYYRKDKFEDLKLPTQETDTTASLARELAKAYNPAMPKPRYDTMKGLPEFIDLHKRVDRCQINWETEDNHRNKYENDEVPVETLCSTTVVYAASQPRSCDYPNQEVVSCTQRQRIQQHRSVEQTDDNHRKEDENEELPEETTCLTANPQTQVEKISIEEQGPL